MNLHNNADNTMRHYRYSLKLKNITFFSHNTMR